MEFSRILYELRTERNISQKKLASTLGFSQASINYWEKGQRTPSIEAVEKIAEFFNVSVDYLMTGEEKTITNVFSPQNTKAPKADLVNLFSDTDKLIYDILDEMLKKEEKEELNRRLKERLPDGNWKPSTIAAHFDGDDYTEEELDKIKEFAQFVKSQRKEPPAE